MQSDQPHVLYDWDTSKRKKGGKTDFKAKVKIDRDDPVLQLQEEANKRARQRRLDKQRKEGYSIEELFNGEAEKQL